MPTDLLTSFLAHLAGAADPDPARLSASLHTILEAARQRWPELGVSEAAFGRFLAERVDPAVDPVDALGSLRGVDLYLACACLEGDARALHGLDAAYMIPVADRLRRSGLPAEIVADARQRIAEALLVAGELRTPRLATYSGRGDLLGWLYIAVAREARRLAQREARHVPEDHTELADETMGADPELAHLKSTYREAFRAAFHDAMSELEERERNLLRLHLLDGLNIDRIASLQQVHRATAARQLGRVRDRLAQRTRALVMQRLGAASGDSDSILRMIRSQLDLSITRALGGRRGEP